MRKRLLTTHDEGGRHPMFGYSTGAVRSVSYGAMTTHTLDVFGPRLDLADEVSAMAPRTFVGQWWLPEVPDEPQPGILTIADDGDLSLEVIGGFDLEVRTRLESGLGWAISMYERSLKIIHGETTGGLVTLIDSRTIRSREMGRLSHHVLRARRALLGIHVADAEAQLFASAEVCIENLLTWLQLSPAQLSFGGPDGESSASLKQPPVLSATGPDFAYEAGLITSDFYTEHRRGGVEITGHARPYLRLTPLSSVSYSAFDSATKSMMDLLTLASDQACGIVSLFLTVSEGRVIDLGPDREPLVIPHVVEVIGRHIHTADPDAQAQDGHKFLFTCEQVPFDTLISRWLAVRTRAEAATNVLFGMNYSEPRFLGTQALLVSVTAEALHRTLYDAKLIDSETKTMRSDVLAALADARLRAWASERLRNEPSYRERLLDLANRPAATAVDTLIPDREQWATDLGAVRNGLAHRADHDRGLDLVRLTRTTSFLLRLALMSELGIDDRAQLAAVRSRSHLYTTPPSDDAHSAS